MRFFIEIDGQICDKEKTTFSVLLSDYRTYKLIDGNIICTKRTGLRMFVLL